MAIPPLLSAPSGPLRDLNVQGVGGQRVALAGMSVGALIDLDDDVLIFADAVTVRFYSGVVHVRPPYSTR